MRNELQLTSKPLLRLTLGLLLAVALSVPGRPQGGPRFTGPAYEHADARTGSALGATTVIDLALPPPIDLDHALQEANLQVQFDAGSPYAFGDLLFSAGVKFSVFPLTRGATEGTWVEGTALCTDCSISLSGQQPAGLYSTRLTPAAGVEKVRLRVTGLTPAAVTDSRTTGTNRDNVRAQLQNALRLTLSYRFDYRIDWRTPSTAQPPSRAVQARDLHAAPVRLNSKVYRLEWSPQLGTSPVPYVPNYQVQVLRLYNQEDLDKLDDSDASKLLRSGAAIRTSVDWSKALTIETESPEPRIQFTIAEGSGFYAWRVRPVGTFYAGGTADARNYGPWSSPDIANRTTFTQNATLETIRFFWHTDPDEGINHIYSRTFTEGNRVSEKITYASAAQQVRQTQAYLPSQSTTGVSQTIYDYSNRPAVTTLPAPLSTPGGLPGYQPNLVRPATPDGSDRPYNAEHFDQSGDPNNTTPINQNDTPFRYYGGVHDNVPDAQGYPFTRSRYYNDGSNRVQEQSGVGLTHSIRSLGAGEQARTVRTEYGTASSDELVRLFGDEAPAAASVLKTSTMDQNGVETITYTSKEGKVIATCLVNGTPAATPSLMTVGADAPANVTITDRITENVREGNMLIATRRLVLTGGATTVTFRYTPTPCLPSKAMDCLTQSIECNYDIEVLVRRVDGQSFAENVMGTNASWSFMAGSGRGVLVARKQLKCAPGTTTTSNADWVLGQIELPGGTYVVEKHLVAKNAAVVTEQAAEKVRSQVQPLTDLIMAWLNEAKCDQDIAKFHKRLTDLAAAMAAMGRNELTPAQVASRYAQKPGSTDPYLPASFVMTKEHNVELAVASGVPQAVYISSACCKKLKIPVGYAPVFNRNDVRMVSDQATGDKALVNPFLFVKPAGDTSPGIFSQHTDFFPDFEGYAYSFFWDCVPEGEKLDLALATVPLTLPPTVYTGKAAIYESLNVSSGEALKRLRFIHYRVLAPYMTGWDQPGTFNLMVQHMLKDQYNVTGFDKLGAVLRDPAPVRPDACGESAASLCSTEPGKADECKQYRLDDLFRCWVVQLTFLRGQAKLECPYWEVENLEPNNDPPTVSEGVDDENNQDGTVHDSHIDDNIKSTPWITRWLVKKKIKKISKRMRMVQNPELEDLQNEAGDLDAGEATGPVSIDYHAVQEFLNCTGYRFAKILTELTPQSMVPLPGDATGSYSVPTQAVAGWVAYDGYDRGYRPNGAWRATPQRVPAAPEKRIFTFTRDPVYAFKYFEYVTSGYFIKPAGTPANLPPGQPYACPEVEFSTCFTDPNVCRNAAGQPVPCNGAAGPVAQHQVTLEPRVTDAAQLSNFCDYGRIKCDVSHLAWTAGQRYSFFVMLNNYREPQPGDNNEIKPDDYLSPGYVLEERDADDNVVKRFLDWENGADRTSIYATTVNAGSFTVNGNQLRAKVEVDISALNRELAAKCGDRREEYAGKLSEYLDKNCYRIGGCKTAPTDNVVPLEDFNMLVDLLVEECKHRGQISTFRTTSGECRSIRTPKSVIYSAGTDPSDAYYTDAAIVEYGAATEDAARTLGCPQAVFKFRDNLSTETFTGTGTVLRATPALGSSPVLNLYDCSGKEVDFKQWLHRREAVEMTIRISLPSRCDLSQTTATVDCEPPLVGENENTNPNVHNNTLPTVTPSGTDPNAKPVPTYRSQPVGLKVEVSGGDTPVVTPTGRNK